MSTHDPNVLPPGLPVPSDDGAAKHLPGMRVPSIPLPTTDGADLLLGDVRGDARRVVYAYPRTGRPGETPLVEDWDLIPGARGARRRRAGSATTTRISLARAPTSSDWPLRTPTTSARPSSGCTSRSCSCQMPGCG
jgi:peroxiredoxin